MADTGPYASLERRVGRPREHWHVHEYGGNRLDALALRRRALAEGADLATLDALVLTHGTGERQRTDYVSIVVDSDPLYGVRLWLVCPRCGSRRVHLYHVQRGVGCRVCLRIRYRAGRTG